MGSGCNGFYGSKCDSNVNPVSSDQVVYQGDPCEKLGVCTGDTVTEVEEAILNFLCGVPDTDPQDITLSQLVMSTCSLVEAELGSQPKKLINVLHAIMSVICDLKSEIDDIVDSSQFVIDVKCLTGTGSTLPSIVQALITGYCDLKVKVDAITGNVTTLVDTAAGNFLANAIKSCGNYGVTKAGTGSTFTATFYGFVPPFAAIPYFGPLSLFDSTGKGIDTTSMCGWYLCNGANGTPDMRGRVPVGSIIDIQGGGALDAAVNPANPANPNTNYKIKDKFGEHYHTLTATEGPSHTHTVTEAGHYHTMFNGVDNGGSPHVSSGHSTGGNLGYSLNGSSGVPSWGRTSTATTGVTISAAGQGVAHENRQPSIACAYIMRIS